MTQGWLCLYRSSSRALFANSTCLRADGLALCSGCWRQVIRSRMRSRRLVVPAAGVPKDANQNEDEDGIHSTGRLAAVLTAVTVAGASSAGCAGSHWTHSKDPSNTTGMKFQSNGIFLFIVRS